MKQVLEAIVKDFEENEQNFLSAAQAHNRAAMRKVLHKMMPIAESLQYESLSQTIAAFKEVNFEPVAVQRLIKKMQEELILLYIFLKKGE